MMEWILTRPVVITLAVAGGILSLAAAFLRKRRGQDPWTARIDAAAYVFMGVSVLFFIIVGLRGQEN